MGMDCIELLLEIEDEFGLHIPDEDAEHLATVGQTVDYLVGRLRERAGAGGARCATAHAFYALRAELLNRVGGSRRTIRPDSLLGDILPKRERRHWPAIAEHVGLRRFRAPSPKEEFTLADIIRLRALPTFLRADGEVDESAVFEKVCRLAAEMVNVDPRDLHRETHFIRDLGMD